MLKIVFIALLVFKLFLSSKIFCFSSAVVLKKCWKFWSFFVLSLPSAIVDFCLHHMTSRTADKWFITFLKKIQWKCSIYSFEHCKQICRCPVVQLKPLFSAKQKINSKYCTKLRWTNDFMILKVSKSVYLLKPKAEADTQLLETWKIIKNLSIKMRYNIWFIFCSRSRSICDREDDKQFIRGNSLGNPLTNSLSVQYLTNTFVSSAATANQNVFVTKISTINIFCNYPESQSKVNGNKITCPSITCPWREREVSEIELIEACFKGVPFSENDFPVPIKTFKQTSMLSVAAAERSHRTSSKETWIQTGLPREKVSASFGSILCCLGVTGALEPLGSKILTSDWSTQGKHHVPP